MAKLNEEKYLSAVSSRLWMLVGMMNSSNPKSPEELDAQRGKLREAMGRWMLVSSVQYTPEEK